MSKVPAGWERLSIRDVASLITKGATPTTYGYDFVDESSQSIMFIGAYNCSSSGVFKSTSSKWISQEANSVLKRSVLKVDDTIFCIVGNTIGSSFKVSAGIIPANINQNVALIRPLSNLLNSDYLHNWLRSSYIQMQVSIEASVQAQPSLSLKQVGDFSINLPPLPEQTKIAQILSTWDKAIATTEQLIGNSQQQKKALMQSLLTGKKRLPGFEGEWTEMYLKNIVSITYGKSPKDIFQNGGKYPVIGTGGVTGRTDKYLTADKSVILGRKGTIDKPMLVDSPFWAIDTTFYCQPIKNVDIRWFYYWICNIDLSVYNEASGVPSISRENLYRIQAKLPPLPEQQKIAAVLTAADNEIELLKKKLVFLKQEKTALMQQLLTGKRRVKINTTEECMDA